MGLVGHTEHLQKEGILLLSRTAIPVLSCFLSPEWIVSLPVCMPSWSIFNLCDRMSELSPCGLNLYRGRRGNNPSLLRKIQRAVAT